MASRTSSAGPRKKSTKKKAAIKKKAAMTTKSAKKNAPSKTKAPGKSKDIISNVDVEQRYQMIAEAAYYIAEKNGFSGDNYQFWLQAETQISKQLGG